MATGTINFYSKFKQRLLNKEIDFDSNTFLIALLQSGYTPGADHSVTTQLTNEVAAGGYARATLASLALAATGSAVAWSAANVVWTASGAAFTAHYWVLIDDTATNVEWDGPSMKATNAPEAAQYLQEPYRKGWELPL